MCSGQDDTDGFCLVFADLAAQPGGVDTVLYRLDAVGQPLWEPDQLSVEMCPACIGICRNILLPLGILLSIWHDIPLSLPLPRCRSQTAYCVLLISVRFMVIVTAVKSRPVSGGICLESEVFPQLMGFLTAERGAEAVKMP